MAADTVIVSADNIGSRSRGLPSRTSATLASGIWPYSPSAVGHFRL